MKKMYLFILLLWVVGCKSTDEKKYEESKITVKLTFRNDKRLLVGYESEGFKLVKSINGKGPDGKRYYIIVLDDSSGQKFLSVSEIKGGASIASNIKEIGFILNGASVTPDFVLGEEKGNELNLYQVIFN